MRKLLILSTVLLLTFGCQENEQDRVKTRMKFSMTSTERVNSGGRSTAQKNSETPAAVVAEVIDLSTGISSTFQLNVYNLAGSWVSDDVELYSGQHQLTKFFVISQNGEVIYATPIKGSELAQFVNDPLPIDFEVGENSFSIISPQVIALETGDSTSSFGYVGFVFDVVDYNDQNDNETDSLGYDWDDSSDSTIYNTGDSDSTNFDFDGDDTGEDLDSLDNGLGDSGEVLDSLING